MTSDLRRWYEIPEVPETVITTIQIPVALSKRITKESKSLGVSKRQLTAWLLEKGFEHMEEEDKKFRLLLFQTHQEMINRGEIGPHD